MTTTASMASPSNKCRFDDDEGPSSILSLAPLRQRLGDEVGAEAPPVVRAVVPQGDSNNDDEGSDSDGKGSGSDDLGSNYGEGNGSDGGEDKAMCVPFRTTLARIMWFKCPVCLKEEYVYEAKVVLHVVDVIIQDAGSPNMVE
jgi:hypothetical protein